MIPSTDLTKILDNMNDAVFLHDLDGDILYVNEVACDRMGYSEDELLAMTVQGFDDPEPAAKYQDRVEQLEAEGQMIFESTHMTKDGGHIPVEINATPVDFHGDSAILSVARDISEQKRREEALREVNQRLGAVIEASPAAIIVVDPQGRVETWNPAAERLFGWTESEVLGEPNPIVPESKMDEFEAFLDQVYAGESISRVETVRQTKDGSLIDVGLSTAGIRDSSGTVVGVMGILQDISDRKASERALQRTNEQLRVVNRIIRHDIRNDMAVTVGWSQELEAHVDDEGQPILDRIQETSKHVVDLTKTVRDFIEALGSDEEPPLQPIVICEILDAEVAKRKDMYPDAVFTITDELPAVTVEANQLLSSVFRNILNNAVQHNDSDTPRVEIECELTNDSVRVRVADNGPGIPSDQRDAIFGRREEGLDDLSAGVGLYLVDQLVESYNGDVWIEDNEPEGAIFVVELPIAE